MSDRVAGDPHPDLEFHENGAYYIGDLGSMMHEVEQSRRIEVEHRLVGDKSVYVVELYDVDGSESLAEFGSGTSWEEATRYAYGAYLD